MNSILHPILWIFVGAASTVMLSIDAVRDEQPYKLLYGLFFLLLGFEIFKSKRRRAAIRPGDTEPALVLSSTRLEHGLMITLAGVAVALLGIVLFRN